MQKEAIEGFRLSPQQKDLWPAQQKSSAYRCQCAILIEGEAEPERIKSAIAEVVARHEALRTAFIRVHGMQVPVQVVRQTAAPGWRCVELADLNASKPEEAIEALLRIEGEPAFDFGGPSLLRAALVRLAPRRWALILTLPAMCADAWTLKNLLVEISRCYQAQTLGEAVTTGVVQYVQFSEWQNDLLDEGDAKAAREYWHQYDLSLVAALRLPFERRRDGDLGFAPRLLQTRFEDELLRRIESLAGGIGASSAVVLFACWQMLLWRLTGQSELVTGYVFDGRPYEELHEVIGLMQRWAPVRGSFEPEMQWLDVVRQTHSRLQAAQEWQEYFTHDLYTDSGRLEDELPAAPILFEYGEQSSGFLAEGLTFTPVNQYSCTNRFKLKLSCVRSPDHLTAELHYDASVYAPENAARLCESFKRLLEKALVSLPQPISELEMLGDLERQQLVIGVNDTQADYPAGKCIHQLFQEQVKLNPHRVAVRAGERQLTFSELNASANRLAHVLRAKGVGGGDCVGLCMDRTVEMMVAIIAILKAGGAYVPLDPEHPKSRLAHQLATVKASVLIAQQEVLARLPDFAGEIICPDRDASCLSEAPETAPALVASPKDLAYVIFTSGSTGAPKGVGISHESLVNYSFFICRKLALADGAMSAGLHFALVSTISADLGNTMIFPSLISGGCLHLLDYEMATNGELFARYATSQPIDVLKIVPTHMSALFSAGGAAVIPKRFLLMGGDVLSFDLVDRIRELSSECRIINHYGPTEATVGVLTFDLAEEDEAGARLSATVPIGRPISNATAYILDQSMRPVPVGVVGELYVGGAGLAWGYINQPAQTAERFVPNPFSRQPGDRLYQTGDLTRYLPDGAIEFLGRGDHQVKIRGYRIELGEIEAALLKHESVTQAVVLNHGDAVAGAQLIAYVVSKRPVASTELQSHLAQLIPSYMVPTSYFFLDALPLTPNGKVDRKSLPGAVPSKSAAPKEFIGPRTKVEETLAIIWAQALGLERVGIHDNFLSLGGDSILSIQVVSKANRAGLRITARQLFTYPTIAELAAVAEIAQTTSVEQGEVTGEVELSPIQCWFFDKIPSHRHHYNQALLLATAADLDPARLRAALARLLAHHDALRARFQRRAAGWQQRIAPLQADLPLTVVDLSAVAAADQRRAIEATAAAAQASLDLANGPLLRLVLMRLAAGQGQRLLIVIHHLVVDGVSWRVLLEDLQSLYEQLSRQALAALPAKTSSYQQWSGRLREYAESAAVQAELEYWRRAPRQAVKRLPVDAAGGRNQVGDSRIVGVRLSAEETRALLQEVPGVYRTQINDVLLSALAQAFADWTGNRCLLIDMEGHGREEVLKEIDVTRTVGFFTATFPMYLEVPAGGGPGEVLKAIKEQVRELPHKGMGYGLLRYLSEDAAVRAELAGEAAEVSFNYLGQFDQVLGEGGWLRAAGEGSGASRAAQQERVHLIDVVARVVGGQLWVGWEYSEQVHRRETIERLAASYVERLREVIGHCGREEAGGYTKSDFELAAVGEEELAELYGRDRQIEDVYPLSPMQQGMLLHSLYETDSRAYLVQMTCLLRGEFNQEAFKQAWRRVIERHAVLRTSFMWEGVAEPLQVVHKRVGLPLEEMDWRGKERSEQEEELSEYLERDRRRGFELTQAPLMRLTLIRLDDNGYQLIFTNHHLLIDGWCRPIILKEVFACYEAFSRGQEVAFEPARPYRDYIRWLQQQDMAQAEAFWKRELAGFDLPTPLGVARATRPVLHREDVYRVYPVRLAERVSSKLEDLTRRHELTLNTIVQAAWALLLSRYSASQDVCFGVTVSGRPATLIGVENMVGMFINTLPMRVQVPPDESLIGWLKALRAKQVELSQYEFSSLVEVQACSGVSGDLPLFESILVFENYPLSKFVAGPHKSLELGNVRSIIRPTHTLTLIIWPGKHLNVYVLHDSTRFESPMITMMMEHLNHILEQFALRPEARLSDIGVESSQQAGLMEAAAGLAVGDELEQFDFDL